MPRRLFFAAQHAENSHQLEAYNTDSDPALFVSDFQDANKIKFFSNFLAYYGHMNAVLGGSGSGSTTLILILLFSSVTFKMPTKISFFSNFLAYYILTVGTFTSVFKDKRTLFRQKVPEPTLSISGQIYNISDNLNPQPSPYVQYYLSIALSSNGKTVASRSGYRVGSRGLLQENL